MFGNLKDKLCDSAVDKAINKFAPSLKEHMDTIKTLKPTDIQDNIKFKTMIISPMLISVSASSGGVTKLIPKFDERFQSAMLHVRNELVLVENDKVKLVEDSETKLPNVLLDGFKQSA